MLKLVAEDIWTYIYGSGANHAIDSVTSYKVHGRWFSQKHREGHWDGIKRLRTYDRRRKLYRFPTGFLQRVCESLNRSGLPYSLDDQRFLDAPEPSYELSGVTLRQYQKEALDAACLHGRGIINLATGLGKTALSASLIKSFDVNSLVLVHRQTLLYQTQEVLEKRLETEVGIVGDGVFEPKQITVAMVQTLTKKLLTKEVKELLNGVELLLVDESHHLESEQFIAVCNKCPAPYRFGLTATACTDGPGLNLIGVCGDILYKMDARAGIEEGFLIPPKIWFARMQEGEKLPKSIPYQTAYKRGVTHYVKRNEKILQIAKTFMREGKNCITLVRRINHGKLLLDLMQFENIRVEFIHGKVKKEKRREYLQKLWDGELDHIIAQAETMGEGVDIPYLQCLINATATKGGGSARNSVEHEIGRGTIQYLGRGLRPAGNKDYFEYVDFYDSHHKYLLTATKDRINTLEDEGYASSIKYWAERNY